ncbi:hypothetical protein [Nocardia niwae]|uniref:hypothetical protein n=1 Tax=Nocardia niwae TaxID=626084 RepID=UPI0033DC65C2
MKGDRVEIVVDVGDGSRNYEIGATRAGRRVEVRIARGVVEVSEVTRSGVAVRTARFMAGRTLALVEHPANATAPQAGEERRTRRAECLP